VVDAFYERLRSRAATIDELLSDAFEPSPGANGEAELTARRFAAWCRAAAAGDPSLFARRLERDRLTMEEVRARLTAARPRPCTPRPTWIDDAVWIEAALQGAPARAEPIGGREREVFAFEELFLPLAGAAPIELRFGRLAGVGRPYLQVADRGRANAGHPSGMARNAEVSWRAPAST